MPIKLHFLYVLISFIIIASDRQNRHYNHLIMQGHQWFFDDPTPIFPDMVMRRSSSAPRPEHPEQPQNFIQAVFGDQFDTLEQLYENIGQYRRNILMDNLRSFSYSRAHHYHYNLFDFPRDPQSVSYAKDASNSLKATFSKDNELVNGIRRRDLLNRQYFTLPRNTAEGRRESHSKNISHQYLEQTENKKIHFDSLIITYRQIIKRYEELSSNGKLNQFELLKRDRSVCEVFNNGLTISEKKQLLQKRLERLQYYRKNYSKVWAIEDNIHFSPSCNQRLYESSSNGRRQYRIQRIAPALYSNYLYFIQLCSVPAHKVDLTAFLSNIFKYSKSDRMAISETHLSRLKENKAQLLGRSDGNNVIFPLSIFHFGSAKIIEHVGRVLVLKTFQKQESQFQMIRALLKKLLNVDISLPQAQFSDEDMFKQRISTLINSIRAFPNCQAQPKLMPVIDDLVDYDALEKSTGNRFILKRNNLCELTGGQFFTLMQIHWICIALAEIEQVANSHEQFAQLIASRYYPNVSFAVGQAAKSPRLVNISDAVNHLIYSLARPPFLNTAGFRLEYEFISDLNVAFLWRVEQVEQPAKISHCLDSSSEKGERHDQSQQQDYENHWGKKVKQV